MPPEWNACARQSRVCPCYTTWCAPIIRCRSASLAVVQPNHRLPEHSTMRRAQQCRYFARSLPPRKRHSRLTIVRRGCKRSRLAGVHGEAMYTAPDSAGCAALRATDCQCAGSRGALLVFLWGFQRGCSLWKENTPFDRQQRPRAAFPLRAVRGKNHPTCKATTLYTPWCKTI